MKKSGFIIVRHFDTLINVLYTDRGFVFSAYCCQFNPLDGMHHSKSYDDVVQTEFDLLYYTIDELGYVQLL